MTDKNKFSDKLENANKYEHESTDNVSKSKEELDKLRISDLEYRRKEAEVDELIQRNKIRKWIVWLGVSMLAIMLAVLVFAIYKVAITDINDINYWFAFILISAPIVSITAITVVFLVGAFKSPKEKDSHELDKGMAGNMATLASMAGRGNGVS